MGREEEEEEKEGCYGRWGNVDLKFFLSFSKREKRIRQVMLEGMPSAFLNGRGAST